jgi:hypothetical protein
MTESKKLIFLRQHLVRQRRAIADSCQTRTPELLNGADIKQIQDAIDAVDRAIADELVVESKEGNSLRSERRDGSPNKSIVTQDRPDRPLRTDQAMRDG